LEIDADKPQAGGQVLVAHYFLSEKHVRDELRHGGWRSDNSLR
jgi:hypothetical protein